MNIGKDPHYLRLMHRDNSKIINAHIRCTLSLGILPQAAFPPTSVIPELDRAGVLQ